MSCPSQSAQFAEFHNVILTTQLIEFLVSSNSPSSPINHWAINSQTRWLTSMNTGRFWNMWGTSSAKHPEQWQDQDWLMQHDSAHYTLLCHYCSLWLIKSWMWSPSPLTWFSPIWSHIINEWNCNYEGIVAGKSLRFRNCCWLFYIWFQKVSSSSSRNAGYIA